MDEVKIPKDDAVKHYSPLMFRFLQADVKKEESAPGSPKMPSFMKEAIMEKQK